MASEKVKGGGGSTILVFAEKFKDHIRDNLSSFVGSAKYFPDENVRKNAEKIYRELVGKEKELKESFGDQFKKPLTHPPKGQKFDLDLFSSTTIDNDLTKALKKNFLLGGSKAAWEYLTLNQSNDILKALAGESGTQKQGGQRDKQRFGDKSKEMNQNVLANKGKGEPMDTSEGPNQTPGGSFVQSQAVQEKIDRVPEHLMRSHFHGRHPPRYEHPYPHPDGPPSDDEKEVDDSKNKILHLLWTHQDFFDPKALSRAQAEYEFYRQLEKQWKRALRRVNMKDINYPEFALKKFYEFQKNRPLYAVILTILDMSKDRKVATEAAAEYFKMSVLEEHLLKEKMLTTIPQGIELDTGTYQELYEDMKTRFKGAGKNVKLREASEFKMVTLWEYLKLKETITTQRNQIEDLASRLSGIASQQLADGDPGFTDLGDKNRPQKLGERFAELFDETWSSAYEALKPKNQDADDDESDEPTMDKLQQVVKVIYEYCKKVSDEQIGQIVEAMIPPALDPVTNDAEKHKNATEQMRAKTEQMAREYRKVVAAATVKVLQKEIMEKEIKDKLLKEPFGKELQTYVDECIDLIWYMCIQQPQMEIMWAKEGDKFNREHFRFSGRKGKTYKLTVWPAVFLHKDGPLVAPGYAVPSK